ncbi:alpha/beta hydrolase [Sphaerisporangium sp. TRM90804]|uniref:alpha/beta fold hydrolase n=1 Tax=Sphaerisporangium sp. TRM90804 TaxID=3031113 RepID=UPI00244B874A|nr:alpha/beta hydrolase [Sphaerisporangium sp. TRM90804]MDH2425337.1 alpha/beta hydrolase [Sphaerisporangium sp. TRM90804]
MTESADAVVLLHGWPGGTSDYRLVVPLIEGSARVFVPDLFDFGSGAPEREAAADAHAERLLRMLRENDVQSPVIAGYDIGSRIAQALARRAPDAVRGLVVTPPYPGVGDRPFQPAHQAQFWYQHFHRLDVSNRLLDGDEPAIRAYLAHFWRTWSRDEGMAAGDAFEALVAAYSRPGAFTRSVAWYRANRSYAADQPVRVPTVMLWPERDPLFPVEWSDRVNEWFSDVRLITVPGSGHFVPLQAPRAFADAVSTLAGGR